MTRDNEQNKQESSGLMKVLQRWFQRIGLEKYIFLQGSLGKESSPPMDTVRFMAHNFVSFGQ